MHLINVLTTAAEVADYDTQRNALANAKEIIAEMTRSAGYPATNSPERAGVKPVL